jgi:hypothetical protein
MSKDEILREVTAAFEEYREMLEKRYPNRATRSIKEYNAELFVTWLERER